MTDDLKDHPTIVQFMTSFRMASAADESWHRATDKSRTRLLLDLQKRLVNKDNRVHVLAALIGQPIQSQNELTQGTTSALIKELEVENECLTAGEASAITLIERVIEANSSIMPYRLFPREQSREESTMPDMPEDAPF